MIPYTIKIDLDGQRDIYTGITLSVGDFGYGLILDFGRDITGYNIAVYARGSGLAAPIPDVATVTGGKGYYAIKPSMYAYAGETQLEIVLTGVGFSQVTKVLHFPVRSGFSSAGNAVASETDYTILSALIQQAQSAITSANAAAEYANSLPVKGLQYLITPPNAINKDRADLILTGTDDAAAINAAFMTLDVVRANSDIAVRVDFLGGDILIDSAIEVPDNFIIFGNGVTITTSEYMGSPCIIHVNSGAKAIIQNVKMVVIADIAPCGAWNEGIIDIINCACTGASQCGILNEGISYITGCILTGNDYGIENRGNGSIIIGNRCSGNFTSGIYDTGTGTVMANNITA